MASSEFDQFYAEFYIVCVDHVFDDYNFCLARALGEAHKKRKDLTAKQKQRCHTMWQKVRFIAKKYWAV